jgi:uncharacterized RDD family membrane protein YckC
MDEDNVYSPPASDLEVPAVDELASRWARLGGSLLDGIIMTIISAPVMYYTGFWDRAMSGNIPISDTIIYGLFGLFVYLALNGYLLSKHGQTIGKRVVGTRIISTQTNEIIPLWKVFFVRYLPVAVSGNIPFAGQIIVILDSLFIFRKDKRCIHDLITGTKVIRENALQTGVESGN